MSLSMLKGRKDSPGLSAATAAVRQRTVVTSESMYLHLCLHMITNISASA